MGFSAGRLPLSTPFDLPGLVVLLRADLGIRQASNAVSAWLDPRNNGHGVFQATPAHQPTLNPADPNYNYQPTTSWTRATTWMSSVLSWAPQQAFTVYVVGEMTLATAGQMEFFGDSTNNPCIYSSGSGQVFNLFGNPTSLIGTNAVSTKQSFCAVFNGGVSSALYIQNSRTPNVQGATGTSGFNGVPVLGASTNIGANGLTGKIAEFAVCLGAHAPNVIAPKFQYDNARYGTGAA